MPLPEATVPKATVPEATVPEATVPEATVAESASVSAAIKGAISVAVSWHAMQMPTVNMNTDGNDHGWPKIAVAAVPTMSAVIRCRCLTQSE
jgi:hypothetical protein